ncbi:ATP-binding protein [Bacillus fonticola]|uniref:ATP-binding protein n=1 Tax=Bacillus fonticola TaxID=2728853 RepID=UPI0014735768|nr:ATP-binding protein [Bacillus fonticola]
MKTAFFTEVDILVILSQVNKTLNSQSCSPVDMQKVLVSISELTKNVLFHSKSFGVITTSITEHSIEICVTDQGIGITSIDNILQGLKNPSSKGLGLGLLGVKNMMDEFTILSNEKEGTTVIVKKYFK